METYTDQAGAVIDAHALIDEACEKYKSTQVYAAFSGGHDSLTSTHITSRHKHFKGVIHLDTSIGIPETQQFVIDICTERGWPLHIAHPAKIWTYSQMILRFGFPGPAQHRMYYQSLKNNPLSKLLTTLREKPGQNIILCTGMRQQESARRMGKTEAFRKEANIIWTSPIFGWSATDVSYYVTLAHMKRNKVKDVLHISGECLCGCFADKHERQDLATWFPHVNDHILKLERMVESVSAIGVPGYSYPAETARWGWGAGNRLADSVDDNPLPMCHFCTAARVESLAEVG